MHRIEMNAVDQRIAKVCDPATANRWILVYRNPHVGNSWHAMRLLPSDMERAKEALASQGCEIVISNHENGEWNSWAWLRHYRKDAPVDALRSQVYH